MSIVSNETIIIDENEPLVDGMVKISPIIQRFELTEESEAAIRATPYSFGFGGLGETTYYRTYSQVIPSEGGNLRKEQFPDTIVRVVKGVMSIRKDWYLRQGVEWKDDYWQDYARRLGISAMKMNFLPPGRGLWVCGTEYVYSRGSMALNNCGAVSTAKEGLVKAVSFTMDGLMCGVGIGFDTDWKPTPAEAVGRPGCEICGFSSQPLSCSCKYTTYVVHDSREGWVKSVELLLKSYVNRLHHSGQYVNPVQFDYSKVRPKGARITGFGGTASGAEPLQKLHSDIRAYFQAFYSIGMSTESRKVRQAAFHVLCERTGQDWCKSSVDAVFDKEDSGGPIKTYDTTRLIVDIMNRVGACVISGNVRRSALISLGSASNTTFIDLKNYEFNPERGAIGWMSNNTVTLDSDEDFQVLPVIAGRIKDNGEPGLFNRREAARWGRIDRKNPIGREAEADQGNLINPCGEIPLCSGELCCLSEIFPTRCQNEQEINEATEFATFYASTVSLLATHWSFTNQVICNNHRIGVAIGGIAQLYDGRGFGVTKLTEMLKHMYKTVRKVNQDLSREAGVREAIRVTTIKPSGTISLLVGVTPGCHFGLYEHYIRRMRISDNSDMIPYLKAAGYHCEPDVVSANTTVISFPVKQETRPASQVSVWEQASISQLLQRVWSDNAVSVTLYFDPASEAHVVEKLIASTIPLVKTLSSMAHSGKSAYKQLPYEEITEDEYERMASATTAIDWSKTLELPEGEGGCTGDSCTLKRP
jgi:ribonucleoside-diphosphate reductase alpha chain